MFSFSSRKSKVEAAPVMRHIVDVTTPNKSTPNDTRADRRYNRSLAVLMVPSKDTKPFLSEAYVAITQDFSDSGVAVISPRPISHLQYIVSVWPPADNVPEPIFLACVLAHHHQFAPDFWFAGLEVSQVLPASTRGDAGKLRELARAALRMQGDE